jgi:hypothetical protein
LKAREPLHAHAPHRRIKKRAIPENREARRLAVAAIETRAANRASDLAPVIAELQAAGATSLRAIADGLNAQNIPTARGQGEWSAVQVARVLERLDPFVAEGGGSANSVAA